MNQFERPALLIIDAQNGFADFVTDVAEAAANIGRLREAARTAGIPVIFTQEMHRANGVDFGRELDGSEGAHCLEGTPDVDVMASLAPQPDEYIVIKRRYSAFFATDLEILLKGLGIRTLVVCGFLTDVCVQYTCVDAHQHDYTIKVATDAVSGSSRAAHEASLQAIRYLQREALSSTEDLIGHAASEAAAK